MGNKNMPAMKPSNIKSDKLLYNEEKTIISHLNTQDISNKFTIDNRITLFHGDCLKLLQTIPDHAVNLIITSPPYNIGKEYENRTKISEYYKWQRNILRECYRILKKDDSIF